MKVSSTKDMNRLGGMDVEIAGEETATERRAALEL
jgi:hypothetical protein